MISKSRPDWALVVYTFEVDQKTYHISTQTKIIYQAQSDISKCLSSFARLTLNNVTSFCSFGLKHRPIKPNRDAQQTFYTAINPDVSKQFPVRSVQSLVVYPLSSDRKPRPRSGCEDVDCDVFCSLSLCCCYMHQKVKVNGSKCNDVCSLEVFVM